MGLGGARALQVEQLKTRNAEQGLVDFLLGLCKTDTGPCRITLPYGKSLLAARLGMRPESLSRNPAHLAGFGVYVNGEEVAIDNVELLAEHFAGAAWRWGAEAPGGSAPVGFGAIRKHSLRSFSLN